MSRIFTEASELYTRVKSAPVFLYAAIVLVLAAVVRLGHLRLAPPFIDESGHIYCATHYDSYPLLERLRLGKAFGYVVFYPTAKFAADPLLATRMLVASIGLLTTFGVFVFTRRVANTSAAVFAAIFWALMPYVVFHDRMALHDPIASVCVIWSMVACVDAVKRKSLISGAVAGLLLGIAALTKVTSAVAVIWAALTVAVLLDFGSLRRYWTVIFCFITGAIVPILAIGIAWVKSGIAFKSQFLEVPTGGVSWQLLWSNVRTVVNWFTDYDSRFFTIFVAIVLVGSMIRGSREKWALLLAFVISLAIQALLFKAWFPRYFLPSLLPVVILAGIVGSEWIGGAAEVWRQRYRQRRDWLLLPGAVGMIVLLAGSAYSWVKNDYLMAHDRKAVELPSMDRFQYLDGWPIAYGLDEVAGFLNRRSEESGQKLLVFVGGWGAHGWWSMPFLARRNRDITFRSMPFQSRHDLSGAVSQAAKQPTFVLVEPPEYDVPPSLFGLVSPPPKMVFEYKRPRGEGGFQLYALDPSSHFAAGTDQKRLLGKGLPMIVDIFNPNGLEVFRNVPFMWLGGGDTTVQIDSPKDGVADLEAVFSPGPSVTGSPERHLILDEEGRRTTLIIGPGPRVLRVTLRAGQNRIVLSCLEKPTVAKQPSGDTRPLILMVQGLRVVGFHAGRSE